MSSQRDEMAELIDTTINEEYGPGDDVRGRDLADALHAAGYRKYPYQSGDHTIIGPECFKDAKAGAIAYKGEWYFSRRIITTVEELAVVKNGTVVRSDAGSIACRFDAERGVTLGDDRAFPWGVLALPVTVLWELNV